MVNVALITNSVTSRFRWNVCRSRNIAEEFQLYSLLVPTVRLKVVPFFICAVAFSTWLFFVAMHDLLWRCYLHCLNIWTRSSVRSQLRVCAQLQEFWKSRTQNIELRTQMWVLGGRQLHLFSVPKDSQFLSVRNKYLTLSFRKCCCDTSKLLPQGTVIWKNVHFV